LSSYFLVLPGIYKKKVRQDPADPLNVVLPGEEVLKVVLPPPKDILGSLDPHMEVSEERVPCLRETSAHFEFLFRFIRPVMFAEDFDTQFDNKVLSEFVPPYLESYAVITYVNNYDSWKEKCELVAKGGKEEESRTKRRFTEKTRGTGKYKGWSAAARGMYMDLTDRIIEQRADKTLWKFDEELG